MKFLIKLGFILMFVCGMGAQTYNTGIMHDSNTGQVKPARSTIGSYFFTAANSVLKTHTGTSLSLSWTNNQHYINLSGNTTFAWANTPTESDTVRQLRVIVLGNGSRTFTTSETISWQTSTSTPINGFNEYFFEYVDGTVYGWQISKIEYFEFDISGDETTAITTGTAKYTWRTPYAFVVTDIRASLTTSSSSGNPAIDINEGGTTIFSVTLTIDSGETTSTSAATAYTLSDTSLANDASITFDIDTAGTGAAGLKVKIYGYRN